MAVYFIVGIDRILEWKWGILAAEGVLMAGVIFFRVKKDEEETGETEEDWEVEFREEEDRERGGMPDKIDTGEIWRKCGEMQKIMRMAFILILMT